MWEVMMMVDRKPGWLHAFCSTPPMAGRLFDRRCQCGRWIVSQRDGVWDEWDAGLITGDDIMVAIILGRRLALIRWMPFGDAMLMPVGEHLDPTGRYLSAHDCRMTPISVTPVKPPRRPRQPTSWRGPHLTDEEISKTMSIWKGRKS